MSSAHRPCYALYGTILGSSTQKLGFGVGFIQFHCFYQKWEEKEEFEFSGLLGQISNVLTLFFKIMCAKICQVATKREKIFTIENV